MNPVIARLLAAVGVILSLASIWTPLTKSPFGPITYWNASGHGLGIALLVLAIVAALGLLLAAVLGHPILDRLWLLAGATAGGVLLFYPIVVTSGSSASELRAGGWLGVAAFVFFVVGGALLPLTAPSRTGAAMATPAAPAMTPPSVETGEAAAEEPESGATDI